MAPSIELRDDPVVRAYIAVARVDHARRVRVRHVDRAWLGDISHERHVASLGAEIECELGLRGEAGHELVSRDRDRRDGLTPWRQLVEVHRRGHAEEPIDTVVVEYRREVVAVRNRGSAAANRSRGATGRQLRDASSDVSRNVVARADQQVARPELVASVAVVPAVGLGGRSHQADRQHGAHAGQ